MSYIKATCPKCQSSVGVAAAKPAKVTCPKCSAVFSVRPTGIRKNGKNGAVPVSQPFSPPPLQKAPQSAKRFPVWAIAVVFGVAALLLIVPIGLAIGLTLSSGKQPQAKNTDTGGDSIAKLDNLPIENTRSDTTGSTVKGAGNAGQTNGSGGLPPITNKDKSAGKPESGKDGDPGSSKKKQPAVPDDKGKSKDDAGKDAKIDGQQPKGKTQNDKTESGKGGRIGFVFGAIVPVRPTNKVSSGVGKVVLVSSKLKHTIIPIQKITEKKKLRLAVLKGQYDDLGSLLSKLGKGYDYDSIVSSNFFNLRYLRQYDVIFLNCGGYFSLNAVTQNNIQQYVLGGGTIYASDLQYNVLAKCFSGNVVSTTGMRTLNGNIEATVVDEGLKRILGPTLNLRFDLTHKPAAFNPKWTRFYLAAPPQKFGAGSGKWTPMLAKFPFQNGHVIFTSYHNSKNISAKTLKLLLYIIFSAVNSDVEAKTFKTIETDGFKAREGKNLNISEGLSLTKQTIEHKSSGKLRVGLGFRGPAKLKLQLFTPKGKVIEHTGKSSFVLEIDDAPAGKWGYSVSAIDTPFDNFPFTIMIANQDMVVPAENPAKNKSPKKDEKGKIKLPFN